MLRVILLACYGQFNLAYYFLHGVLKMTNEQIAKAAKDIKDILEVHGCTLKIHGHFNKIYVTSKENTDEDDLNIPKIYLND